MERAFSKIPINQRSAKPRAEGLTEIRGPYGLDELDMADLAKCLEKAVTA